VDNLWIGARPESAIVIFWHFTDLYEIVMVAYQAGCYIFNFAANKIETLMATNRSVLS
jgi:hypothetical protein